MDDLAQIGDLVGRHFDAMCWDAEKTADWDRFKSDFLPDAQLFPAARPVATRSLDAFVARMKGVAETVLHSFEEHTTTHRVMRFGNVAVVLAASEMLENGSERNQDISGYLLVKSEGEWKIAAHAWDKVTPENPIPDILR